jgi:hypothetical protein
MRLTGLNKSITNALGKLSPQPKQTIVKGPIGFPAGGMGAAMRGGSGLTPVASQSGSGLTPVASQSGSGLTPVASQSGSAMGITPPPGGAGLASMSTQQMQGILKGTPVGYSGPKMTSFFGNKPLARHQLQQPPTRMKEGGSVKNKTSSKTYKSGGSVSSASKRADGCAIKGKTRGKMV